MAGRDVVNSMASIEKLNVWRVDTNTLEIEEMTIAELRWSFNADMIRQESSYLCASEDEAYRYMYRLKQKE